MTRRDGLCSRCRMMVRLLSLCGVAWGVVSAFAASPPPPPQLQFAAPELSLDTLCEDDPVQCLYFPFRVTQGTVTLAHLRTSCACTSLHDYPRQPLAAGDTGVVSVLFSPAGQRGDVLRVVSIYCEESPADPLARLFLSAYVTAPRDSFYTFPYRSGDLRLLQDHISLSEGRRHRSLIMVNASRTTRLKVRVGRKPSFVDLAFCRDGSSVSADGLEISPAEIVTLDVRLADSLDPFSASEALRLIWQEVQTSSEAPSAAGQIDISITCAPRNE